jgi:zinc-ribbon domain
MFCPKCAAQNVEGASFCRVCGANISLIPQALSGQLPQARPDYDIDFGRSRKRRGKGEPTLDHAVKHIFMGIAFMLISVALAFSRMGNGWWFWMLIPAFSMMGTGVAQYIRIKERDKKSFLPGTIGQSSMMPPRTVESFPTRSTGELVAPPPSVTEGTTRHLGAEATTRHFDKES